MVNGKIIRVNDKDFFDINVLLGFDYFVVKIGFCIRSRLCSRVVGVDSDGF